MLNFFEVWASTSSWLKKIFTCAMTIIIFSCQREDVVDAPRYFYRLCRPCSFEEIAAPILFFKNVKKGRLSWISNFHALFVTCDLPLVGYNHALGVTHRIVPLNRKIHFFIIFAVLGGFETVFLTTLVRVPDSTCESVANRVAYDLALEKASIWSLVICL